MTEVDREFELLHVSLFIGSPFKKLDLIVDCFGFASCDEGVQVI